MATKNGFRIGDLAALAVGGGFPEGDYIAADFTVMKHQAENKAGVKVGAERLGVMVTFLPMEDPREENKRTQFYSFGSSAIQSWAPNPETGKGIVALPGGKGGGIYASTNYGIFLKSLYDAGLPTNVFEDDFSVLDGTWVHIANIPEPEERKGFASTSSGEGGEEPRRANFIPVVTEIKDDGKPWEGGGGVPEVEEAAAPVKKVAGKAPVKPAAKPVAAAPKKAAPATETADDDEVTAAAINGVSTVLEKSPDGVPKMMLRTGTFKAVTKAANEEMAGAVIEAFFKTDKALEGLVSQLGYTINGLKVEPAA